MFDPVATDSTPESPAIANYSFSLIISSPALTTITLRNGTILDACASSPYCPLFPNLTPPIAYDTDDSGKHQKFITNTGLTVARKLGKERGFDKWCVRPSLDDILADQKQMETVLVVAGWIAAEMDMEVKEIQDQA